MWGSSSADAADAAQASPAAGDAGAAVATTPDPLDFDSIQQDDPFADLPDYARENWLDATTNTITLPGPQAGGTSTGTVPAGLEKFYSQKIDWQMTSGGDVMGHAYTTYSTYVSVPLDYEHPDNGKTVELYVSRSVSTYSDVPYDEATDDNMFDDGDNQKWGVLFVNPGGPGASGAAAAEWAGDRTVGRHYEVVGFDPRGVGSSLPADPL